MSENISGDYGPALPAGEAAQLTRMGDLVSKSRVEIERLQDIHQRINSLYDSLFGAEPSNEGEDPGATTGPASTMDMLLTMSYKRTTLIDYISNRLACIENDLRP